MNSQEDSNNLFRQKRDEYLVEIRKKKSKSHLKEKRLKLALGSNNSKDLPSQSDAVPQVSLSELTASFISFCKAGNVEALPDIAEVIRKKTSEGDSLPINELADTGVIPYIVEMLKPEFYESERLVIEASWIIANIASKEAEHVNFLVGQDMLPLAVKLLEHPNIDIKDNALWILANICGESLTYRNILLNMGIVSQLEKLFQHEGLTEVLAADMFWLISNLCAGKPYPDFSMVASLLTDIAEYIQKSSNPEILQYCISSLVRLADTEDERQIQEIIDMDVFKEIFFLLTNREYPLIAQIVKLIERLLTGSDEQAQELIDRGVIEAIAPLLDHPNKDVVKKVCGAFSNILACSEKQIRQVFEFEKGGIIKELIQMVLKENRAVAEECIYALTNACNNCEIDEIQFLVNHDLIELLVESCDKISSNSILKSCIVALEDILIHGGDIAPGTSPEDNPYVEKVLECGGFDKLESLQNNVTQEVFDVLSRILDTYAK